MKLFSVTIYLFLTAISKFVILNHNSFRVLCCLIKLLPYISFEKYFYFSIGNGQPRESALCHMYRHTFVSLQGKFGEVWICGSGDMLASIVYVPLFPAPPCIIKSQLGNKHRRQSYAVTASLLGSTA